ncbi:hypothetical protein THAOC_09795, partial [Thalassiosira oceanica]
MNRDGITSPRHARPPEHGTDAPMAHSRPGYRSRSIPGPTAVDRRRWFGLDRCNGHGLKARPGAPEAHRACTAYNNGARFGSSSSPIWS